MGFQASHGRAVGPMEWNFHWLRLRHLLGSKKKDTLEHKFILLNFLESMFCVNLNKLISYRTKK